MGSVVHGCFCQVIYTLLNLTVILPFLFPRTSEKVNATISVEDLAYLQYLPKARKMELFSQENIYTYQTPSLYFLVVVGRCNVLAMYNPSKEGDTQKKKCEVAQYVRSPLHKKVLALQEELDNVKSLQQDEKLMGPLRKSFNLLQRHRRSLAGRLPLLSR